MAISRCPLEEVDYVAEIEDDFGLGRYGLTYNINGGEMQEIPLANPLPATPRPSPATC